VQRDGAASAVPVRQRAVCFAAAYDKPAYVAVMTIRYDASTAHYAWQNSTYMVWLTFARTRTHCLRIFHGHHSGTCLTHFTSLPCTRAARYLPSLRAYARRACIPRGAAGSLTAPPTHCARLLPSHRHLSTCSSNSLLGRLLRNCRVQHVRHSIQGGTILNLTPPHYPARTYLRHHTLQPCYPPAAAHYHFGVASPGVFITLVSFPLRTPLTHTLFFPRATYSHYPLSRPPHYHPAGAPAARSSPPHMISPFRPTATFRLHLVYLPSTWYFYAPSWRGLLHRACAYNGSTCEATRF